jgi:hypothetical protein
MTTRLIPCPECARHVRASEARCPFCSAPLDFGTVAEMLVPAERLGRSSALGFQTLVRAGLVAATSSAFVACGEFGDVTPLYGAPGVGATAAIGGFGTAGVAGVAGVAGASASGGTSGEGSGGAGTAGETAEGGEGGAVNAGGAGGEGGAVNASGEGGAVNAGGEGR